ncbi:hypothetical protein [Streptomyces sp. NPDC048106]|uniref:hypothetical protein n=1 Tax=Streptomyces sp. NPDC048106 TaxID=3155750 RepID=UPI00345262A4
MIISHRTPRYEEATRERVIAQVKAAEFQAGQRRIIEGVDAAHRQTARGLHHSAQQRLVSLLITLRLARQLLDSAPPEASCWTSPSRRRRARSTTCPLWPPGYTRPP